MTSKVKPSAKELTILKSLWTESLLSARELQEANATILAWSFSSTRKTLERMHEKSFLKIENFHGIKVFLPKVSKVKTLASYVSDFANRIFEVDQPLPVSMFAESKLLDDGELKELEALINSDEFKDE